MERPRVRAVDDSGELAGVKGKHDSETALAELLSAFQRELGLHADPRCWRLLPGAPPAYALGGVTDRARRRPQPPPAGGHACAADDQSQGTADELAAVDDAQRTGPRRWRQTVADQ